MYEYGIDGRSSRSVSLVGQKGGLAVVIVEGLERWVEREEMLGVGMRVLGKGVLVCCLRHGS